jgi:hypothetical protein
MGTQEMKAEVRRQAERLLAQLAEFDAGPAVDAAEPPLVAFVDRHIQDLDKQLSGIVQGARAVREWHGEQGRAARRTFLIRGYIRGFAHQWRHAGVRDVDAKMLEVALGRGWRIAGEGRRSPD